MSLPSLSIDSALSSMGTAPATPGTAEWIPDAQAPVRELPKEEVEPAAVEAPAADTTPAADDAVATETPTQDDASAAADDDGQGSLPPPVVAPNGWTAEEKEVFKSLPPAAQAAIARREQDRTTELRNLQNGTADQRKAADAEVTRLQALNVRINDAIGTQVNELSRDFPEIKSQADIEHLAVTDPARFSQFQARLMRFNGAQQAAAEAATELQKRQNAAQQEVLARSHTELLVHFPTWKDKAVATKEVVELQDYAIKLGASEQAARALHDPMVYRLAHKAMLYDRAQAAKTAAINREAPRVVKPGTTSTNPKADAANAQRTTQLRKLDKSGDIEDALSLMFK
jgi:hypothetical protein